MNEDLQTNELTFQKVFDVLKRSFVRILIYALVLAILGGGITAIATIAGKGSAEYKTIIEYNYVGIEEGKDPLGNIMDTNRIKSTIVVNNALKNMGITDNNVVLSYSQILIDSLSVNGYVSAKMAEDLEDDSALDYFPTRYIITLTENKKLNFKDTQYVQFLNELVNSYRAYFKDAYNYGKVLSLSISDTALEAVNDYYDLCIDYKLAINDLLSKLDTLKNNVTERYNKLRSNIDVLNYEVSSIEDYIIGNNVTKVNAPFTLTQNLTAKKTDYEALSTQNSDLADKLYNEAIKTYLNHASTTTTDGGLITTTRTESKYYDELIKKYNGYRQSQYNYTYRAGVITTQLGMIGGGVATLEQRANVENRLIAFDTTLNNTLESVNEELELYSQQNITENGVKTAMAAAKTQVVNYLLIIIVAVVCGFVGCIVAVIVAQMVEKRQKNKVNVVVEQKQN